VSVKSAIDRTWKQMMSASRASRRRRSEPCCATRGRSPFTLYVTIFTISRRYHEACHPRHARIRRGNVSLFLASWAGTKRPTAGAARGGGGGGKPGTVQVDPRVVVFRSRPEPAVALGSRPMVAVGLRSRG